MSAGERFSPGLSPIVPLIPDMLLINATVRYFNRFSMIVIIKEWQKY